MKTMAMDTQNTNENEQHQHDAQQPDKKGGIHNNALYAASMGRAATSQVRHNSGSDQLAQTGTNIIYESATAPGSGGSAGTGFTSGQPATGASIASDSDYERAAIGAQRVSDDSQDGDSENPDHDADDSMNKNRQD
jgi:hypothetical protein